MHCSTYRQIDNEIEGLVAVSNKVEELLDAAEQRIRQAGYNGFSFRDLAADTGIKSASVHHHFPTKAALAAAVARRYTDHFFAVVKADKGGLVAGWRTAFLKALKEDNRLCLCGMLGAESTALPPEVAAEAKRFFQLGLEHLAAIHKGPGAHAVALQTFAILEGAMLIARTLGDPKVFDQATTGIA
jgi:TetR/AcrR family transcriptional repressor of nem operon